MKNSGMKCMLIICALFMISNLTSASTSRARYDSLVCLEIEGKILNAENGMEGECQVELFWNNKVIKSITLKEGKRKFKFTLERNRYYGIRITKKGYISKLVCVDTKLINDADGLFRFLFETELIKEKHKSKLNGEFIDFPVAIVAFDEGLDYFTYNKEYTEQIKKELYRRP
jgi:hypothetical protein